MVSSHNCVAKCASVFKLLLILFFIGFSVSASAQVSSGAFSGRVTDPSGAVVPNAKVVVQNAATGVATTLTTNSAGLYSAPSLNPGTYEITVTAPGFVTSVRAGLTLTVGAQEAINFKLQVGAVQKTITVTGAAPMIQTSSSVISAVVNEASVQQLPLNGRSWTDLAALQPGVDTLHTQPSFATGGDRGNRGFGQQMTISGARPQQANYLLDGISLNDYANGAPGSVLGGNLGVDAIREFSVLTSNYSTQYGKTSGGVVNAVTRSGTNAFHGAAYEFIRNDKLDAANYFEHGVRSPFKRNQFGADLGGPIRRNKTFFFGDFESVRQGEGIAHVDKVPSFNARNGNLTTGPVTVSAAASAYLPLFPLPNNNGCPAASSATSTQDVCTFSFSGQQVVNENFFTTRIDQTFSDRDSLFGTYMFDRTPYASPDPFDNMNLEDLTNRQILAVQETHTFSASFINAIRFGYNHEYVLNNSTVSAINPAAADPSLNSWPFPAFNAATVNITGLSKMPGGVGAFPTYLYHWNDFQVYDDANYLHGTHNIKFGLSWEREHLNYTSFNNPGGVWTFSNLANFLQGTAKKFQGGEPNTTTPRILRQNIFGIYVQDDWQAKPNFTVNLGLRYEMATVPTEANGKLANLRNITDPLPVCGTFVQGGCSGTGGFFNNPTLFNFEPRLGFAWSPLSNGKLAIRGGAGMFDVLPLPYQFLLLADQAAPFFAATTITKNLSFYNIAQNQITANSLRQTYIQSNPARNYTMQWNLNTQYQATNSLALMVAYVGSRGVHMPFRADEINIIVPSQTSAGYLWPQVDVLGNLWNPGLGCTQTNPKGTDPSGCVAPQKLNPNYGDIRGLMYNGMSYYNALQVQVTKRMSHGVQIGGSFTWGKSMDTSSASIAGDQFSNSISSLDWYNLALNRGLSDYNVSKTLVVNVLWNVPGVKSGPAAARWVTDGWQVGGIMTLAGGVPFTPTWATGSDPQNSLSSDSYSYMNVLTGMPGCSGSLVNPGNPNNYIKTQCFSLPTAPNQAFWNANCDPAPPANGGPLTAAQQSALVCYNLRGNAGRTINSRLIGPGVGNLDFSVYKNNPIRSISENFNIQFRAEFFNITNHPDFSVPSPGAGNTDVFDSTGAPLTGFTGVLTSTTVPQREIQFALKVSF